MNKRNICGIWALLIASLSHGASANNSAPTVTVADMYMFNTNIPVVGATILTRKKNKVSIDISTTGLASYGAYSIWWVVFNNPENCEHGIAPYRCGLLDLPGLGGSPDIDASLFWAGGAVATSDGSLNAAAEVRKNKPRGQVVMGTTKGLRDVSGADIHIALRSHGTAMPGSTADQIGRFNGGCPPGGCTNSQASIHEGG